MEKYVLNCKGAPWYIEKPVVMGIINVTQDSFYDGGKLTSIHLILQKVEQMLKEGANIIDIGGISTRPNATKLTEAEELKNIIEPIKAIHQQFPDAILSIDTFRSAVAEAAIQEGVSIINDISGGTEEEAIFEVAAKYHCPYILMHHRGGFDTMHHPTKYENFLSDVIDDLNKQINKATQAGVLDIIIEPGFGFSKSIEQNYYLLKNLPVFQQLGKPVLAGLSRKSMLYKPLQISSEEALSATTAVNMIALMNGASILRVHDVKEAKECIDIYQQLKQCEP